MPSLQTHNKMLATIFVLGEDLMELLAPSLEKEGYSVRQVKADTGLLDDLLSNEGPKVLISDELICSGSLSGLALVQLFCEVAVTNLEILFLTSAVSEDRGVDLLRSNAQKRNIKFNFILKEGDTSSKVIQKLPPIIMKSE